MLFLALCLHVQLQAQSVFCLDSVRNQWGLKTNSCEDSSWQISPQYLYHTTFKGNVAVAKHWLGHDIVLTSKGEQVQTPIFTHTIGPDSDGKIALLISEKISTLTNDTIRFQDSTLCFHKENIHYQNRWKFYTLHYQTDTIKSTIDSIPNTYKTYPVLNEYNNESYIGVKLLQSNKWIIKNPYKSILDGKHLIANNLQIDSIIPSIHKSWLVKVKSHWGLIDSLGVQRIAPNYSTIQHLENSYWLVKNDSTGYQYLKPDFTPLNQQFYKEAEAFSFNYARVKIDSLWGLIDTKGKQILEAKYHHIGWPQDSLKGKYVIENLIGVQNKNGFWGVVSIKNKIIIPQEYNTILPPTEGLIATNKTEIYGYHPEGVWGFFDTKGKIILPHNYDALIQNFKNGIAITGHYIMTSVKPAELSIRLGFSDKMGKELSPFIYRQIRPLTPNLIALQNEKYLWGFADNKGKIIHQCAYNDYILLNEKELKVDKLGKWGLVNTYGRVIYEPIYKSITPNNNEGYDLVTFNSYAIIDDSTQIALHQYDEFKAAAKGLFIYGLNGYYGLMDTDGKVILANTFNYIGTFKNGSSVVKQNGKFGLINLQGNFLLPCEYDSLVQDSSSKLIRIKGKEIHDYGHTKVVVSQIPKWGLTDSLGKTVLEIKHPEIQAPSNEMYPIKRGDYWGFYNHETDQIIPFQFTKINQHFTHNLALVTKENVQLLINKNGEIVNKHHYDSLKIIAENTILCKSSNKYGLLNHKGEQTLPFCYDKLDLSPNGLFIGYENNNHNLSLINPDGIVVWGDLIDSIPNAHWSENMLVAFTDTLFRAFKPNGKQVLYAKPKYEKIEHYSNGFARVTYMGLLGFIDENGKLRVATRYNKTAHFHEDMCAINLKDKWGYIDKGEYLWVQPYYDSVMQYQGGLGAVNKAGKWGFTNKKGEIACKTLYSKVVHQNDGFYAIQRNNHWGMLNPKGEEFAFTKYDEVAMLGTRFVAVKQGNKYGVCNLKGDLITQIEYDNIYFDPVNNTAVAVKK